jgi:hypothetical protein
VKEPRKFYYDIIQITRGVTNHPYYDAEVVGEGEIELDTFGYVNGEEIFHKWSTKTQREYTKTNTKDARVYYIFRHPQSEEEE